MKRTSVDIAFDLRQCLAVSQLSLSQSGSKRGSWVEEALGFALKDALDLMDELDALLAKGAGESKVESELNALNALKVERISALSQWMINQGIKEAQSDWMDDPIGCWVKKIRPPL